MERPPIYEKLLAFFPDSMARDEAEYLVGACEERGLPDPGGRDVPRRLFYREGIADDAICQRERERMRYGIFLR